MSCQGVNQKGIEPTDAQIKMVKDLICSDKIVIFSKSTCPYSNMVKKIFEKCNENVTAIELDKVCKGQIILNILEDITGAKSVPRIFVNGEFLGGGTDIQALFASGTLNEILNKNKTEKNEPQNQ